MEAVIRTEGLTKTYGRRIRGIEDVNLEVSEGEVFGFLGPNGAGKTTTIRTLLNFLRPTEGRVWVFGMDTRRESVRIRGWVGNLPGEFALEDRMTGEKLLRFFARLRGVGDLEYAYELAEHLGADLHRPMRRLSRGNKQKIGLVQAMFHKPPLLILDEPTGGLDPLVHEEFLKIIGETKAEGRTVFFSSHVLSEVERISDRVGIIREGRLVDVEPTEALVNKAFRHVRLTFAEPVDAGPFAALPGVKNLEADRTSISFTLYDNLDEVIKLAARNRLVNMDYERPSLEEVFLTYYGHDGEGGEVEQDGGTRGKEPR
jgi:ABC-2 type transport system ATP-binding protein